MSKEKKNHTLLGWLQHVKHHHDERPQSVTIVTPNEQKYVVNDPVLIQHDNVAIAKPHMADLSRTDSNNKESLAKSKPASVFSVDGAQRFKHNLIHFHRPHGLLFHNHSTADHGNNTDKQRKNGDTCTDSHASNCACCNHNATLSFDADDELDEQDEGEDGSVRSKDWTKHPPCLCNASISGVSVASSHSNSNEDNSVSSSLPDYIHSPEVGFKKLKKDGDLVDWDELSTFMEQADEDYQPSVEYAKSRLLTRSAIRHDLIRLALNGLFQSPIHIESKKHVLHVGCGNGAWCTETAKLCPNWLVFGMDDKSGGPSPDQRKAPKNFKYILCYYDILKTLKDIPADSFDFIYIRFLLDTYGDDCYQELVQECYRICKSEGYVELYELDMRVYGSPKAGPITHKLNAKVFQNMESHNLDPRLARKIGDLTSDIFNLPKQDPLEKKKKFQSNYTSLPLGVWGGRLGVLFRDSINDLFMEFTLHDDLDSEASDDILCDSIPYNEDLESMDRELDLQKSFMNLHHVYARKCSTR